MICRQKQRASEWRGRKGGKNTTEEAIWNGKERDGCSLRIIEGVSRHNRSAWWSDRAGNFFSDGWLHVYILMGSIDRGGKEAEIYKIYTYRDCANTSSIFSFCHVGKNGADPSGSQALIHHPVELFLLSLCCTLRHLRHFSSLVALWYNIVDIIASTLIAIRQAQVTTAHPDLFSLSLSFSFSSSKPT